jgi:histone acetyltransferase MYST1
MTATEEATDEGGDPASAGEKESSESESNEPQESESSAQKKEMAKASSPASGGGIDAHPFARASVIEVLHGVKEEKKDSWWSDDSQDEEEEQDTTTSVRLCDVIDRVPTDDGKWRYYVHYRDFNRRMDEWIGMDRIVSPPSVGNAKARALKKLEEREKRKQARLEERNAELVEAVLAPRSSRRRSTTTTPINISGEGFLMETTPDSETPRMTRRQRRKSNVGEDDGGTGNPQEMTGSPADTTATQEDEDPKEVLKIATSAATQTKIGEHVIATIPAQELDEHEGLDEASLREHEEVTKVKNCAFLELGQYQMETWYFSPLPKELLSEKGYVEILYVCEFSFRMFARKSELLRYQARELPKNRRHPPGNEIYRNGNLSSKRTHVSVFYILHWCVSHAVVSLYALVVFEVDGSEERIYCQNLCYIAKLFLDHKTLYFDVDPFLFYILCEVDERGFHPVGYFSKEKYSDVGYNLACILTFPSHQRKGYGRFLIAFSYELTKKEEKVGSPEKPMSDLGQQAYKPYWNSTIVDFLLHQCGDATSMSIMDISKKTSIMAEDIVFTLNQLGILKIINGVYFIAAETSLLEQLAKKHPVKDPKVDSSKLHWTPFVTDVKRDKFSIHSKKPSVEEEEARGAGGF